MTQETDKSESVKLDPQTIRAVRIIAASSGRSHAAIVRRAVLTYYEAYLDGCAAAAEAENEKIRRGA